METFTSLSIAKSGNVLSSKGFSNIADGWNPIPNSILLEPLLSDDPKECPYRCIQRTQNPSLSSSTPDRSFGLPASRYKDRKEECLKWVEEWKSGILSPITAPKLKQNAFLDHAIGFSPQFDKKDDLDRPNSPDVPVSFDDMLGEAEDEEVNDAFVSWDSKEGFPEFNSFDDKAFERLETTQKERNQKSWIVHGGLPKLEETYSEFKESLAMQFPFELDTFQKEAICNLELGRSVFVAAHTSAGKTAVAEYAFALAIKHCSRAVYTSPIKTISNQKFRDFGEKFEVGIMTGDTQINPHASCLILTTEILRSMLYKGADVTRDMEFVIFDEVHYVNDMERGVVWEETIIMLPPHVQVVLLSATVPNVDEFAAWVGRTRKTKIYISGTNRRPVPLEHNLYFNGKLFEIWHGDQFLVDGYKAAQFEKKRRKGETPDTKQNSERGRSQRSRGRRGSENRTSAMMHFVGRPSGPNSASSASKTHQAQLKSLLTTLEKKSLLPVVVFAFSKKLCDESAFLLGSVDLSTASEVHEIHVFLEKSLGRLADADRSLPQILQMKQYLKRGIGIHHAGLLPIMKEIVEMLFCKGLLKVLFATETFAMGVNAPTRTVIFHSLRKHDGQEFRTLLPGEYTQMAGRAGRRGIDDVGVVVIACWDEIPDETLLISLMKGRGRVLSSRFRLTYSMILNLMRVEDMLKRSFAEFHAQKAIVGHRQRIKNLDQMLDEFKKKEWIQCPLNCSKMDLRQYYDGLQRLKQLNRELMPTILANSKIQKALVNGRVIYLFDKESGLIEKGILLMESDASQGKKTKKVTSQPATNFTVLYLHIPGPWDHEIMETAKAPAPPSSTTFGKMLLKSKNDEDEPLSKSLTLPKLDQARDLFYKVAEITPQQIVHFLNERIRVQFTQLTGNDPSSDLFPVLQQLRDFHEETSILLDTKVSGDLATIQKFQERQSIFESLITSSVHRCPCLGIQYARAHAEKTLESRLKELRHKISDAALKQMPEFGQRLKLLQHFGYVDDTGTVQLKGRVACEINSGDELIITEMIFHGVLSKLTPEEAVAVLSAFVFQEKRQERPDLPGPLEIACLELETLCMDCGIFQFECGLGYDPESYCTSVLNFGLVHVVHEWAKGTSFVQICQLTDVPEGTIVRTIVRLEQSCREVMDAARVMGNTELFQKMQQAATLIKRDVIFAASLYVTF